MTGATGATGVECFVAGTRLATPAGERRIEDLVPGDAVLTASGATATVRWVGRRKLRLDAHPRPATVQPVRLSAHALGPNQPARDLYVSPGHGIFLDDVLIPAGYLVDGEGVTQMAWREVAYLHVELDRHDILLADGLPAESYLDIGHRAEFEGDATMVLHPTFAAPIGLAHEAACAPFVVAGPKLDAIRAGIAARRDATRGASIRMVSVEDNRRLRKY